jgi:hypothetical protein
MTGLLTEKGGSSKKATLVDVKLVDCIEMLIIYEKKHYNI